MKKVWCKFGNFNIVLILQQVEPSRNLRCVGNCLYQVDSNLVRKFYSFGAVSFVIRKDTSMVLQKGSFQSASNGDGTSSMTIIVVSFVKTIQIIYV